MPRRLSPEQVRDEAHFELQQALRAEIGALTLRLLELGAVDKLSSKELEPVVQAWQRALAHRTTSGSNVNPNRTVNFSE